MELLGGPPDTIIKHVLKRNDSNGTIWDDEKQFVDPFEEHPGLTGFLIAMLTVMITLGTFGNVMIITAVYYSKKLRTPANMLIINLTIADLGVSTFVNPFSLVGVINGYEFFHHNAELCTVIGIVCLICCIASLLNIMAIAVNRYVALCKHHIYMYIFTWRSVTVLCIAIWVASILIDMPTMFGWGGNGYDEKAMICLYDRLHTYSYTVFFAVTSVFIPAAVVFFCYLNIFLYVRAKKRQLLENLQSGKKELVASAKAQREEIRLARTLFLIFIVFFVCWGSYAFTVVFDIYDRAPKIWHAISIEVAHFTSSGINFILYGATNNRFRESYLQIICPKRVQKVTPMFPRTFTGATRHDTVTMTETEA